MKKNKIFIWIQALRIKTFTASLTPSFLGAAIAFCSHESVNWYMLPMLVLWVLALHAASNLANDYYDYMNGVDRKYAYGSSRVLVDEYLYPKNLFKVMIILFCLGFLCGSIISFYQKSLFVFILNVLAVIAGFTYCGPPFRYKYKGFGEIFVFIFMGPLIVIASYIVLTNKYIGDLIYISLPISFLVTAMLHANNLRDIEFDTEARIKTLANLIGYKGAKIEYVTLIFSAYISVLALILAQKISVWSLLVLLTFPYAIKNIFDILNVEKETAKQYSKIDISTGYLHLAFGILLILSILLGEFFICPNFKI